MITAFLPCRSGSERVSKKNTRQFSIHSDGLLGLKLGQLSRSRKIDQIVVSTNDKAVKDIANGFNSKKIKIIDRQENLCSSQTSTDDLIQYVPSVVPEGIILWTHTTSPFVDENTYDEAIGVYLSKTSTDQYDSLMSVTPIKQFIWKDNAPINYNKFPEKWPRTQTLEPIYSINSAIFLASVEIYKTHSDRIGLKPYLYEINEITAWDIDWPEDFYIAEKILESGVIGERFSKA
ncbi:MAG: acylneuraminate cytidylyltransferase family protein [Oligoflexales bacterium]|nr:acylneuraminate cytidylyltransferase family protein [Oligoflexales bacterium]